MLGPLFLRPLPATPFLRPVAERAVGAGTTASVPPNDTASPTGDAPRLHALRAGGPQLTRSLAHVRFPRVMPLIGLDRRMKPHRPQTCVSGIHRFSLTREPTRKQPPFTLGDEKGETGAPNNETKQGFPSSFTPRKAKDRNADLTGYEPPHNRTPQESKNIQGFLHAYTTVTQKKRHREGRRAVPLETNGSYAGSLFLFYFFFTALANHFSSYPVFMGRRRLVIPPPPFSIHSLLE